MRSSRTSPVGFKRISFPQAYRYDFTAGLLVGIFEGLTAPFLGVLARQLGASVWQIALLTSIPFYGHMLSLFWVSRRVHFASPLAYVTFVTAMTRVLFLGMAWVTGPTAFVACACLAQFLAPIHGPAYTEVMRQIYPEEIRGKAMGSVRMASSVATMLAASLGGRLLDLVGFRYIFPVAALAGVAASWVFGQIPYALIPPSPLKRMGKGQGLMDLHKQDPVLRRFETAFFLFGFGNLMMMPLVPILLVDRFHASNFFVGELAFVTALARLSTLYLWGHRIDRRGGIAVTRDNLFLMAFVPLCYAFAQGLSLFLLAALISGAAMAGLELGVMSSCIVLAKGKDPAMTMAVHQTFLGARGILAPVVGILLSHLFGFRIAFISSSCLVLLGSFLVRRVPSGQANSGILI